jgi:hypothetical protein
LVGCHVGQGRVHVLGVVPVDEAGKPSHGGDQGLEGPGVAGAVL